MKILVGHTGFVGSNIFAAGGMDRGFNSKNIQEAYGLEPDLLVYAGLRAEKFLANAAPEKDMARVRAAEENIIRIAPKRLVLISTVDVLKDTKGKDEESPLETEGLQAYGYNRLQLEIWVRERFPDALIIRLPALFGMNLKKNFVYDLIHLIPAMLRQEKLEELASREPRLKTCYSPAENGFWCLRSSLPRQDIAWLRERLQELGFTALQFTDSRSRFQFYPLARLRDDIGIALANGLRLWHPATEPVAAAEIHAAALGRPFVNEISNSPADYDFRTRYASLFGGKDGWICSRETILAELCRFVAQERASL